MVAGSLFGEELRHQREARGWTQEAASAELRYSQSLIAQIEAGRRLPSKDFAERVDAVFHTDGLFARIRKHVIMFAALPEWFRPWHDLVLQARVLKLFNPLVVPGLLQTEAYARAHLSSPDIEAAEAKVQTRLARRREIFEREQAPIIVHVILAESVLHRLVGSPKVMSDQLMHLAQCPAAVQILPDNAATYLWLDGPFEIATIDGRDTLYVETPVRGFVLDSPEDVRQTTERWEALLAEALPVRQSTEIITKGAEAWLQRQQGE